MTKLVQKHLLKGTQTFEIVGDAVNVQIKAPFNAEETLTVMLTVLNPEPVISRSRLDFTSRVNNEPLLSLYLGKPNEKEFNAFVNQVKKKALEEYNAFAGLKSSMPAGMEHNVFDEPPEFDSPDEARPPSADSIKPERLAEAIDMLSRHVDADKIGGLMDALKALQAEPQNEAHLSRMIDEFNALGPTQGAVLTYAPYIGIMMSDGPVGF